VQLTLANQEGGLGQMRSLPSFASVDVEHLTYGKLVAGKNGPVPFGRDYEVTRMSAGLARWKFDAMRPSGLTQESWSHEKVDPACEARGLLIVKQVANPNNPAETAVVIARLRFCSEAGEGVVGRRYLQCTSWLVGYAEWNRHASSILAAASASLTATPDEIIQEESGRKSDKLISLPILAPSIQHQFSESVRQILGHILEQARSGTRKELALGNESFRDEDEFLAGIGQALDWLGEAAGLVPGFIVGYLGPVADACLRWTPSRRASLGTAPSHADLDQLRTTLRISNRRPPRLSDQNAEQRATARRDRLDLMNMVVPSTSGSELDYFIRRAKANVDLQNGRKVPVQVNRSSDYSELLECYARNPNEQTATDLMSCFRQDRGGHAEADPAGAYRNSLMLACVNPHELEDINIPLSVVDWALGLAKLVRSDGAHSCFEQLSTNLISMFQRRAVLCPEELDELWNLGHLFEWLSAPDDSGIAKLLLLSRALDRLIDGHDETLPAEEISQIAAGLKRRCSAGYRKVEQAQPNRSPRVPGELFEILAMLMRAYQAVQAGAITAPA
jgi:hypothetical protein